MKQETAQEAEGEEVIEILDDFMDCLDDETISVTVSVAMSLFATVYTTVPHIFQKSMRDAVIAIVKQTESEEKRRAH